MSKKLYIFAGMILFSFLFTGCSQDKKTGNDYSVAEKEEPAYASIQKLAEADINRKYKGAEGVSFDDYQSIDHVSYLAFSYYNSKAPYYGAPFYGFTVAEQDGEQWKLSYIENYPNDQNESIIISQFIGACPGTEGRPFHITSGYVNDELINQIVLYYPESKVNIIQLREDQRSFLDINMDSKGKLLKIIGKSSNEKVLYEKKFDNTVAP